MGYRKLDVNGVGYEYTIGEKFTKVKKGGKSFKIFENSAIGNPIVSNYQFTPLDKFLVTPLNVSRAIEGKNIPEHICKHHGTTTINKCGNPFAREIYNKIVYMWACPICVENCAADI